MAESPEQMKPRQSWLDHARGIAVIAMIVYHFSWDLSFHNLIETSVNDSTPWRVFARAIAGSFLFLAGVSLYLAHHRGIHWQAFLRRLGILVTAAGLVTLGTWYSFPQSYIFFGILHCIALASVICLAFLRAHWIVTLMSALATLVAPWYFANAAFDMPWLAFLGLRTLPVRSNDFVPLLPWISPMLAGLGLVQMVQAYSLTLPLVASPAHLAKPLRFLGRYSLIIYLVHQPLLFNLTGFVAGFLVSRVDVETSSFIGACESNCVAQGRERQACIETCFCTVDGLKATGVWTRMIAGTLDTSTRAEISRMAQVCNR